MDGRVQADVHIRHGWKAAVFNGLSMLFISLLAAACVLFSGAFWPDAPRGAWWCTAFSIAGSETVARQEDGDDGALEFRWGVVDWLRALLG